MKATIRRAPGGWKVTLGAWSQPCSTWRTAMELAAERHTRKCLNEACSRLRADNPFGVCAGHEPKPDPTPEEIRRAHFSLQRSYPMLRIGW